MKLEEIKHLGDPEKTRQFYNHRIGLYLTYWDTTELKRWMSAFRPRAGRILDLGSGNGATLLHYAKLGHACHGIEISDTAISIMEKNVVALPEEVQHRITWERRMIEGYDDGTVYENVLLTEVLEHVKDPLEIMMVAERHLAKDGLLYVSAPPRHAGSTPESHVRGVPKQALEKWAAAVGLRVVRCTSNGSSIQADLIR